jgi:hypothetical protein
MLKVKTKNGIKYVALGDRVITYMTSDLKRCKYCGQEADVKVYEYRKRREDVKTGKTVNTISRTVHVGCNNGKCTAPDGHVQIRFIGNSKDVRDRAIRGCIKKWEELN